MSDGQRERKSKNADPRLKSVNLSVRAMPAVRPRVCGKPFQFSGTRKYSPHPPPSRKNHTVDIPAGDNFPLHRCSGASKDASSIFEKVLDSVPSPASKRGGKHTSQTPLDGARCYGFQHSTRS